MYVLTVARTGPISANAPDHAHRDEQQKAAAGHTVSNLPGHRCLPQGGAFPKVMIIRSRLGRLMMWMALAAGAMYFLDPDRGEERRRELRARIDKMRSAAAQPELDAGV
jgi:hypothetical protein